MGPGVRRVRRDDVGRGYATAIPRRDCARGMQILLPPSKIEGAGNAGCALHPRSRVPKSVHLAHTSIQVSGNTPTSPAQWLYGLYRALPGGAGLLSPSPAENIYRFSASVAAPGPHDFAVRLGVFVRHGKPHLTPKRPSHPAPHVS